MARTLLRIHSKVTVSFSLLLQIHKRHVFVEDILTGLGPYADPRSSGPVQDFVLNERNGIITQKYYQWVCIVFCFQALLFYIPRYLWKTWEGGRLRLLAKDLGLY